MEIKIGLNFSVHVLVQSDCPDISANLFSSLTIPVIIRQSMRLFINLKH